MGNKCVQLKIRSELVPDPATGLTAKDRELIMKSWAKVVNKSKIKVNATNFFILLFKEYPYMIDYFSQFKGKSLDEVSSLSSLRAHGIRVFFAISAYVENIDDPPTLVSLVEKVAKRHLSMNVTFDDMENLRRVFLIFLNGCMLHGKNEPALKSWDKFLGLHNMLFKVAQDQEGVSTEQKIET